MIFKIGICLSAACISAIPLCLNCLSNKFCLKCNSPFFLFDSNDDGNFDKCIVCNEKEYFKDFTNGVCKKCSSTIMNCVECNGDEKKCQKCVDLPKMYLLDFDKDGNYEKCSLCDSQGFYIREASKTVF